MKIKQSFLASVTYVCLLCMMTVAPDIFAGSTVLEFTDAPGGNNDEIPFNFGSASTSNTSGTTVTDGGTPDINLFWFAQGDGWDRHSSNVWSALDSPGNVHVAQLDWHIEMAIDFEVGGSSVFALDSLRLGNATDQTEADYGWDISISVLGSLDVDQSWTSEDLGPGGTTVVDFDFVGEPGTSYTLSFEPNATDFPDDGNGNQFVFRTAIDELTFSQDPTANPSGDFDGNGVYECADIDALVAEIVAGTNDSTFDLDSDADVDGDDLAVWLAEAGAANNANGNPYLSGDANLDGSVDVGDFNIWNSNKFTSIPAWCSGDFNHDGSVDVGDFNIWNGNKFQSSDVPVVPEPNSLSMLLAGFLGLVCRQRFRKPDVKAVLPLKMQGRRTW